jgi:signal transduction histidine kinase
MGLVLILFFIFQEENYSKELEKGLRNSVSKELLSAVIITYSGRAGIAQDLHDDISSKLNIVSLNSHLLTTLIYLKTKFMKLQQILSILPGKL